MGSRTLVEVAFFFAESNHISAWLKVSEVQSKSFVCLLLVLFNGISVFVFPWVTVEWALVLFCFSVSKSEWSWNCVCCLFEESLSLFPAEFLKERETVSLFLFVLRTVFSCCLVCRLVFVTFHAHVFFMQWAVWLGCAVEGVECVLPLVSVFCLLSFVRLFKGQCLVVWAVHCGVNAVFCSSLCCLTRVVQGWVFRHFS